MAVGSGASRLLHAGQHFALDPGNVEARSVGDKLTVYTS
jgi:hypothetical protein